MPHIIIDHTQLDPLTLENIIIEFVSREGTDNGYDLPLDTRINQVLSQLNNKRAILVYDEENECVLILTKEEFSRHD